MFEFIFMFWDFVNKVSNNKTRNNVEDGKKEHLENICWIDAKFCSVCLLLARKLI